MLAKLTIDNYALIDKSIIDFSEGFTVITGETGAGKSIMLDALMLLMGGRADLKAVGDSERKMVVEGLFKNPSPELKSLIEPYDIEWDPNEIILRREISTAGKSRGFVNDTPVNLSVLSSVSQYLIDIHSQHNNSLLNKPSEQLKIIDVFGHNEAFLSDYRQSFREYIKLRNEIKKIKERISENKENKEYILYRLELLDNLKPKDGELESLEREVEILGDADKIKSDLTEAFHYLGGGTNAVIKQIQTAANLLEGINWEILDPTGSDNVIERLNGLKIEIRDISDTLEAYSENITSDPAKYEKIQSRIEALYDAMKRLKVKDEKELVELHQQLKKELGFSEVEKENLPKLEKTLKELAHQLKEKACKLSEAREKASILFTKELTDIIKPLGLPNVRLEVRIEKGKMTTEGQDMVNIYCSFNKNHEMQPISEIASGGEISRLMLGIKSILAENVQLPTIIFDEIDTGVSGEIAHKMGQMMKKMAEGKQVMAVTHLPQVAAAGDSHLKVFKSDEKEKTVSRIIPLEKEGRIKEIASMLSGTSINDVAIENARVLLGNMGN